jgi:transposase
MLTVEEYAKVRIAHRDGMSVRALARTFGHSRRKVREILALPQPKPYTRSKVRPAPVLGAFHTIIDAVLVDDELAPVKQRHTAMQIYRRLRDEYHYTGGYDQVRRYVGCHRRTHRETFIPLAHEPGQRLECDFGHIYVDFPEGRRQVPVLIVAWGYSNYAYAQAMPTERTEAILAGMVAAFNFFGCVPREVWWDNPTTVVSQIFKGRERRPNARYAALASHYTFDALFCMPARGNEKPRVETRVRVLQRQWATPVPRCDSLDAFNAELRQRCLDEVQRHVSGCAESIGERFACDQARALPLPVHAFDACICQTAQVDKYQLVRFDCNRYSVPRLCAFRTVTVKGYIDRVEFVERGQVVASHARSYGRDQQVLDPLHYLSSLERRPAALDHAPVMRDWKLPASFSRLRQALEDRHGPTAGARHYIRVLQLLAEHAVEDVQAAVEACLRRGECHAERIAVEVKRLTSMTGTRSEAALDVFQVPRPDLGRFDQLLSQGGVPHGGQPEVALTE